MSEKIYLILDDLSQRIADIYVDYIAGQGPRLKYMTVNRCLFDRFNEALVDVEYCNLTDPPLVDGSIGMLWGVPIFLDEELPDDELKFNF